MLAKLPSVAVILASLVTTAVSQNVDPIVIKGSKFFYKTNGTQFYIKGIAYQQDFTSDGDSASGNTSSTGYTDPLADSAGCRRDIPYLTQLQTNTIRVYAIDPTKDHTDCMTQMANAGIYVLADLGSPQMSINQDDPQWNTALYQRYTSVVDAMANFQNTLGFFAGNEIITQSNNSDSAPFAKAAVRDMKAYIKQKNYRPMGVGYATNDNPDIRVPLADYMNCGSDQSSAVDFWGYNVYSWCGDATFQSSGYDTRVAQFSSYSVPVFFAEYGCNQVEPRTFQETPVLYGPQMDGVFSGGIVYLYFQETNNYGLVSVSGNSVSTLQDFSNLKTAIASASPTQVQSASYNPTNSPQACPSQNATFNARASPLPPTPDTGLCDCMYQSLGCVASPSVNQSSYGDLFGYVCGLSGNLCNGITANGTTGTYGQYSGCNSTEQLGYVLDQYYQKQGKSASACSFSGSAMTKAATATASGCAARLSSASAAAGSGGSGAAATSSKGAAPITKVAGFDLGLVWAGLILQIALISALESAAMEKEGRVIIAAIREFARQRLRPKFPYLPQPELDKILDKISDLQVDFLNSIPAIEASKARSNFFSLPAELRNNIYELALLKNFDAREGQGITQPAIRLFATSRLRYLRETNPPLLLTCKQIREEALPVYYSNIFVVQHRVPDRSWDSGPVRINFANTRQKLAKWLSSIGLQNASKVKELLLRAHICTRPRWALDDDARRHYDTLDLGDLSLEVKLPQYTKRIVYDVLELEKLGVPMERFKLHFQGELKDGGKAGWCELLENGSVRKLELKA
ncbi:carbohydrate-binding module family 43 [Lecanosticta acicola]|uniref:1,3-beta-glucanosyltransferase n=1 Tax=Lecanosticta acicola TaxID=111012 RepID=A0AAI8Z452_9PEZI|nr:carbohydrate-binding module family 43 [Lecanosticta acicola]